MDCLATFLEFYERQTALNTLKTLSDAFVCSVWLHSFGRFCLLRVVALFRTLLSTLCGCSRSEAFVYSLWLHSFGCFFLLCVVALFWILMSSLFWARLSTLCGFAGFVVDNSTFLEIDECRPCSTVAIKAKYRQRVILLFLVRNLFNLGPLSDRVQY